jgi:hypothetical protein
VTIDVTPVNWITFAFGPAAREDLVFIFGTTAATVVGVTARVDFHIIGTVPRPAGRSAWTIGIVGDLGAVTETTPDVATGPGSGPAWGLYLTAGYAHY